MIYTNGYVKLGWSGSRPVPVQVQRLQEVLGCHIWRQDESTPVADGSKGQGHF